MGNRVMYLNDYLNRKRMSRRDLAEYLNIDVDEIRNWQLAIPKKYWNELGIHNWVVFLEPEDKKTETKVIPLKKKERDEFLRILDALLEDLIFIKQLQEAGKPIDIIINSRILLVKKQIKRLEQ